MVSSIRGPQRGAALALVALGTWGCQHGEAARQPASLYIPPEMRAAASTGRAERATVRMAEDGRVFEAEVPVHNGPYALSVPLSEPGRKPPALGGVDAATEARVQHYLLTMDQVKELGRTGRVELGLVMLEDLLRRHPEDDRLWALKGSLHRRAGQPEAAKVAWRKALELSPGDVEVAEALRGVELEGGP